jgi:hypothetical protein
VSAAPAAAPNSPVTTIDDNSNGFIGSFALSKRSCGFRADVIPRRRLKRNPERRVVGIDVEEPRAVICEEVRLHGAFANSGRNSNLFSFVSTKM